ncbi:aminotransferase class III-fold pyridoxal phosphate-dependent enzyme [Candidatus Pelagibacter ubique]|jgi:glutamate-1-semialdehyde 2,1-aminomutase|nr:aminotransferase class III-fold pyridoxal phosphate-dependent enzyme [Candidatus Pelagibacter ubique]
MPNLILNEGYQKTKTFFEEGYKDIIKHQGKPYIDLSNCAGSLILGHNSKVYKKILKKYLKINGSSFAHPNNHAVDYSKTIKKFFPSFEKIIFCNSGTEAVTKALRISRTLNKKEYIVSVVGSWHGSVDKLLFNPGNKLRPEFLSEGISNSDKKKIIFIPYNDIETSKKILNKNKNKINSIIIEPVQACLPLNNAKRYLKFLENFCNKNNSTLIFDEMVTGVRSDNNSVQQNYKIKPDITTIGKIIGGGMPIGVIGISKKVHKLIKGKKIFYGGTFSGNSLSSFVGNETLKYLIKNKTIIKKVNDKSKYFQNTLNKFIYNNKMDLKIYRYSSILRIVFTNNKINNRTQRDFFENKISNKIVNFKKLLFQKNIYYPSNGIIFFSDATNYKNIDYVIKNIKEGFIKYFR